MSTWTSENVFSHQSCCWSIVRPRLFYLLDYGFLPQNTREGGRKKTKKKEVIYSCNMSYFKLRFKFSKWEGKKNFLISLGGLFWRTLWKKYRLFGRHYCRINSLTRMVLIFVYMLDMCVCSWGTNSERNPRRGKKEVKNERSGEKKEVKNERSELIFFFQIWDFEGRDFRNPTNKISVALLFWMVVMVVVV